MKFTINVCRILLIANSPLPGGVKELAPPLPIKSSGKFQLSCKSYSLGMFFLNKITLYYKYDLNLTTLHFWGKLIEKNF